MTLPLARTIACLWFGSSGVVERTRRRLYGGACGLRMANMHEVAGPETIRWFQRLVAFCETHFVLAGPEDVIALSEGRLPPLDEDRLLFTFDDGHANNFAAAECLASRNIRAIFFVMPSFVGRTVDEFCDFHARNGIEAFRFFPRPSRGLEPSQIREMVAMGHVIGGHNYSHRDLGLVHREEDLAYEIQRSLDEVGEIVGRPCEDFAWGFGHPSHVSSEAADYLTRHCPRVYSCSRGLNVPGRSPRFFLRDTVTPDEPFRFTQMTLRGGADGFHASKWAALEQLGGRCPAYGQAQ